jgi:hypothetical protein
MDQMQDLPPLGSHCRAARVKQLHWPDQHQEDAMKLRAYVTIDADCEGHLDDQEFEKRIQALVAELGQKFVNVQYDIKHRRVPPVRRSGKPTP